MYYTPICVFATFCLRARHLKNLNSKATYIVHVNTYICVFTASPKSLHMTHNSIPQMVKWLKFQINKNIMSFLGLSKNISKDVQIGWFLFQIWAMMHY